MIFSTANFLIYQRFLNSGQCRGDDLPRTVDPSRLVFLPTIFAPKSGKRGRSRVPSVG
jgi:hypothetical protein